MRAGLGIEEMRHCEEWTAGRRESVEYFAHITPSLFARSMARPYDRQVFVERHGKVGHLLCLRASNQLPRDGRIGHRHAPALAPGTASMLGREDREEGPGGRQAGEVRGTLHPDHAAFAASLVRGHSQVGQRAHARTVEAKRHHAASGQILDRLRRRGGPGGSLLLQSGGDEPIALGKGFVVGIGVTAAKEHNVSGPKRPVRVLPLPHHLRPDERAHARLGPVAECGNVNHAGLAAKLPGGHLFTGDKAHWPGAGQAGIRRRHEVRRGVPLRAGVLVDDEHVAMPSSVAERGGGHDGQRRHPDRPHTRPIGRHQQR